MTDVRPLAHFLAVEFGLDYQDVCDVLCDYFYLNKADFAPPKKDVNDDESVLII